eukprot:983358_1
MNSKSYIIIGLSCIALTFTIAVPLNLKPQNNPTDLDDPNEFVVSFRSACLEEENDGKVPEDLFEDFTCIQTNGFASTPNIINPDDSSDTYNEDAIFFKIGDDPTCLETATVDHLCMVYTAYSPKLHWDGLDDTACASTSTNGLPDSDAINLDLLNNKQPYLEANDGSFDYFPLDSDDPG